MPETQRVNLEGKVPDAGAVHFLWAEWQVPRARFVVLRYSLGSKQLAKGLRMDLDKMAILDDVGDAATDLAVKGMAQQIWNIVIDWRREHHETYV
jgi:hypothetical protein